jgi:acetoacetyl-CoA reductase
MKPDVAIVTGAARGIGAAIAQKLHRGGWQVVGFDRAWKDPRPDHLSAALEVDVTSYDEVERAVETLEAEGASIGVLVNNAGITRDVFAHKMSLDDFRSVVEVSLFGAFHLCRAVLPKMRKRKFGRIVSISSINALRGQQGQANYAAAKAGLIGLTKSIALENASLNITANCVAPGFIQTDMTDAMRPDVREDEIARIPVGRIGSVTDVAAAVAFLVSDEAAFVTGQTLSVNGGQLMP